MGADDLLERRVVEEERISWRPVVPRSWRDWVILQAHVGIMGAHRNAKKTVMTLAKTCWWKAMLADCEAFTEKCIVCVKGRKKPLKQEAVASKPTRLEAWEEVSVDMEGPMLPPDAQGTRFVMSYLDGLTHWCDV